MEEIIAKYNGCSTAQYLLPIITNPCVNERTQYRNAISRINVALKEVACLAGLNMPLTMHCARHCWASIAKSKNIPLSVISEGMGHDSEWGTIRKKPRASTLHRLIQTWWTERTALS